MQDNDLLTLVTKELDLRKGENISVIDVKGRTCVTDYMVVVTGTSDRHAQSLSYYVKDKVKEQGVIPLGLEGESNSDWVLLDLGDIIIHIMTAQAREKYQLEKLWSVDTREQQIAQTG